MKFSFFFKILVTVLAIGFVVSRIDFNLLKVNLYSLNQHFLIVAALLALLQVPIGSFRWQAVIHTMGEHIATLKLLRYFYVGLFFSCYLPGGIGGDVFRIWFVRSDGLSVLKSVGVVFIDRLVGLFSLVSFVLLLTPFIYMKTGPSFLFFISLITTLCLICCMVVFLCIHHLPRFLKNTRLLQQILRHKAQLFTLLHSNKKQYYLAFVISIFSYVIQSFVFYMLALSLNIPLTIIECVLFAAPVILLVTVFPFSLAGWGVREGSMILSLASFHINSEKAFLLSVFFGLLTTIINLPGGLIWVFQKRQSDHKFELSSIKNLFATK